MFITGNNKKVRYNTVNSYWTYAYFRFSKSVLKFWGKTRKKYNLPNANKIK